MFRKRLAVILLSLAFLAASVALAPTASATAYSHGVGSYDTIGEALGCHNHLTAIVHFGVDAHSTGGDGIWVDYVEFRNTGATTIISATFHNMSPHGQGHRDLPTTTLRQGQALTWRVNAVFWFTFSSEWRQTTSECSGGWTDTTVWRGPTH